MFVIERYDGPLVVPLLVGIVFAALAVGQFRAASAERSRFLGVYWCVGGVIGFVMGATVAAWAALRLIFD